MEPALAVFFLVLGIPSVIWPYKIARFEERFDAIGSKRSWSEVEPAQWRVTLTCGIGIALVAVAVLGLLG